ncbi:hypothetical protein MTR62_13290 [Novosphingobium sp. 1949]|uniref:Uncharacterized protein n=1 Tax=Novosphingobium organovorum TaxID=2930092 RepID=A0ABT0BF17_9SPHN|nr:hypothetical protein [Novosphingobium organovorum]MCJ2183657.1 hypothetical protein [Novosphingobium organovorum]
MNKSTCSLAALILALGLVPLAGAPSALAAEAPALVAATRHFDTLTLRAGELPQAPQGKQLTLTVDGIETPLAPGTYTGDVTLSVTDDIPLHFLDLPVQQMRTALYVENGVPVWSKSVKAALGQGSAEAGKAQRLDIRSVGPDFNGVIVTGNGSYRLDHPVIDMVGNGGNDFAGFGAAIMATGKVDLTIERPIIRTHGAIRTALFTGDDAVVHVDNAEIETLNGTLPKGYHFTVDLGRMMEAPWMLGVSGNVRASNLVGNGTLYITNSHIRSQGWGGLSTDAPQHVRMIVKDSLIELTDTGYGTYSIGDSLNTFAHSILRSPEVGAIMAAQGSLTLTDATRVEAGTYGVMMHSGLGGGTLTIDGGSEIHAGRAAIEVKGVATTILVDDARITSATGVILQAMENDDPVMQQLMRGELPEGMSAFPPGMGPDDARPQGARPNPDVVAHFAHVGLIGDFWNARVAQGGMNLTFGADAHITGRISTARAAPASGTAPTRATYREIGNVVDTAVPDPRPDGMVVHLAPGSRWTVTGASYLNRLVIDAGARIDGGSGALTLTVNGKRIAARPGHYEGQIVLDSQP